MKILEKINIVTPHLTVRDVQAAVSFYEDGLGFRRKLMLPGGKTHKIMHAEIEKDGSTIMLGPESPERGMLAPITRGVTPSVSLYLYVKSIDAAHARVIGVGGIELVAPNDQFFGARTSVVADPDGHQWMLSEQHKEMSERELRHAIRTKDANLCQEHASASSGSLRRTYRMS